MSLELLTDPWTDTIYNAREMAMTAFLDSRGEDLDRELPMFDEGLTFAHDRASHALMRRKYMPVIEEDDLVDLRLFLKTRGFGDICEECSVTPSEIFPTQCQIYIDKAVLNTAKVGVASTVEFLEANHLVLDKDMNLVDGHHRWLTAGTIDIDIKLPAFRIKQDIPDLIKLMTSFSDTRHARNV